MLIDSVVPRRALAQHGLRDDADAEDDQHERAEELREQLALIPVWTSRVLYSSGEAGHASVPWPTFSRSIRARPALAPSSSTTTARFARSPRRNSPRSSRSRVGRARPAGIWASQIGVAVEALERGPGAAPDVAAIGITNQRETTVVWDRETGEPIHNAIVWQDRRTADFCERLKADGAGEAIQRKTGLLIDAYFSATKIRWMLDNVPGARARAEAGQAGLRHRRHVADLEADRRRASRDRRQQRLAHDAVQHPHAAMGRRTAAAVRHPGEPAARGAVVERSVRPGSTSLGIEQVPIAGIAGDQQAALFGQMCRTPGMSKNTYGTGCFLLQNIGSDADSARASSSSPPWPGRSADAPIRARRQRLHRRRRRAVASRRARPDPLGRRHRAAGRDACPTTAVCTSCRRSRAGRAALGPVRARHDRRHHARHDAPPTSRGRRSKASPFRSRDLLDAMAARLRHSARTNCASTAAPRPTTR